MSYVVKVYPENDGYAYFHRYVDYECGETIYDNYGRFTASYNNTLIIAQGGTIDVEYYNYVAFMDFNMSVTPQIIKPYKVELVLYETELNLDSSVFNFYVRELPQKASAYPDTDAGNQDLYEDSFTGNAYIAGNEIQNIDDPPHAYDLTYSNTYVLTDLFERSRQWMAIALTTDDNEFGFWHELRIGALEHGTALYRPYINLYYNDDPWTA